MPEKKFSLTEVDPKQDIASCAACFARNYDTTHPDALGKRVNRLYKLRIDSMVFRLCDDCLDQLSDTLNAARRLRDHSEEDCIRKALADWRPELNHIVETLGTEELLAQLAEEAAELGKAALKLRRALNDKNPTPVSPADAILNVQEEMADVLLCVLSVGLDEQSAERTIREKIPRWAGRIDHDPDSDCPPWR